ncbi:MAG: hypothetical protein ACOY90_15250 [Candidatus Zhuqueibacterota bacterium]
MKNHSTSFSKSALIILVSFAFLIGFQTEARCQESSEDTSAINFGKLRLPIIPWGNTQPPTLNDEIALLLQNTLEELILYDILVALPVDSVFIHGSNYVRHNFALKPFHARKYLEAIIITSAQMYQEGVYPGTKEQYFSLAQPKQTTMDSLDNPDNVYTYLSMESYFIDIQSGDYTGDFNFVVVHTGGDRGKSKRTAMNLLHAKMVNELKRIYWISADIDSAAGGTISIPLGSRHGIKPGWIFELVEPDRVWNAEGEEYVTPGGSVGFACVTDTVQESSQLSIIRQWDDYYAGSWAVEHLNPVYSIMLNYTVPSDNSYFNTGVVVQGRAIHNLDWGFGVHFMHIVDSYDEKDYGFGVSGFGLWRFLNHKRLDLGARLGLLLDIPFKNDDDDRAVNTVLFATALTGTCEFMLSAHTDIVVDAGYRWGIKNDDWSYSEEEESMPAYWFADPPSVQNSGLVLSVGIKYHLF